MNGSTTTTTEARISPREKNIAFECFKENGESRIIYAVDASKIAARFNNTDAKDVLDAIRCDFMIDNELLTTESKGIWNIVGQKRNTESIIGYDAKTKYRVIWWEKILLRISSFFTFPKTMMRKDDRYKRRILPSFFDKVSRIHLYEAQEKYVFLESTITMLNKLIKSEGNDKNSTFWKDVSKNQLSIDSKKEILSFCEDRLKKAEVLLTRRQNDLNFLWREMTQIHIYLLKSVIPDQLVPEHYDFCCEEEKKLAVRKDPEVNQLINNIAEDKDSNPDKSGDMKRHIRALIERLSTIRTGRIHQQYINICCLRNVLFSLIPLLIILISLQSVFVTAENIKDVAGFSRNSRINIFEIFVNPLLIIGIIKSNILAFVCFSGLLGGFFSAAIRLHAKELEPGSDAYFGIYVITKPVIGAIGAVALFLLFQAGIFNAQILDGILVDKMLSPTAIFGFSFLAGFTERIVFPTLK